ncbi:MAG: hypothetical protein APF82_10125 [Sphingomonadales bacterium BRH_c42]|nr:MAG: hypothetical protein APF82_10125 [Sphingomonadales bacterium BRH_c42]
MTAGPKFVGVIAWATLAFASSVLLATNSQSPRIHEISIEKMKFASAPANLKVGDTIRWINRDAVPHTASARDRSFDVNIPGNSVREMKILAKGRHEFFCRYHPTMKGVLSVTP